MLKILAATHNQGKLLEYRELFTGLPLDLVSLDDLGITVDVDETGATFEENAVLKAKAYYQISGLPTLGDDSGLEVDALNGAPGIYSSRYAGPNASDEARYRKLLADIHFIPQWKRAARFHCVVALVVGEEEIHTQHGLCEGSILYAPKGTNGFGYDPVFYVRSEGKTMAELTAERKNQISHRAVALKKLRPTLLSLAESAG